MDWGWCSLIMLSDGDTLHGDTRSWQPFPLMVEAQTFCADKDVESNVCVVKVFFFTLEVVVQISYLGDDPNIRKHKICKMKNGLNKILN